MSDLQKRHAAAAALDLVQDGMTLGLGSGSTSTLFIDLLGERVRAGLDVTGIPTSEAVAEQARAAGLTLTEGDEGTVIDLAVDGADEVDPAGQMIKGGGAALLREKIVATAATRFVVIAHMAKEVRQIGAFPLPIEVAPFAFGLTVRSVRGVLAARGYRDTSLRLRANAAGEGFLRTDGGNYIIDAELGRIDDVPGLDHALTEVPGVLGTGLFYSVADIAILGTDDGVVTRQFAAHKRGTA